MRLGYVVSGEGQFHFKRIEELTQLIIDTVCFGSYERVVWVIPFSGSASCEKEVSIFSALKHRIVHGARD